jgi:hypothetical protein
MSLEKELAAQQSRAALQWKELVQTSARGGDEPSLAALTKVSTAMGLEIVDAVARFRKDVAHVQGYDAAVLAADAADRNVATKLEPYSGSAEEYLRTVLAAEEYARNLREEYDTFSDYVVPGAGRARGERDRLAKARTDLI